MKMLVVLGSLAALILASAANSEISPPRTKGGEVVLQLNHGGFGKHYAFPNIRNWNSLRIVLMRAPCFGTCPGYSLEIRGNGSVKFEGRFCVAAKGVHSRKITKEQVSSLYEAFRHANFFSLRNAYNSGTVDAPGLMLSIQYDSWSKKVYDLQGTDGLPADAARLSQLIDAVAKSAEWVGKPGPNCMSAR
jgi:hypothetical protein